MQPKVKRVYLPRLKLIIALGLSVLVVIFLTKAVIWGQRFEKQTGLTPAVLARLIFDNGGNLKNFDGRTNVLLLGMAGGTHAGSDLTDTMMVLSLAKELPRLALISIPRDIWSDTLKDKINSAYHYGNEKKPGGGLILAKAIVEDVVGIPIHYALLIDFSGFKELIDLVGGVKVKVSRSFIDPNFPISGREEDSCQGDPQYRCRYETVQFTAGEELMVGERALKYVRSRHAEGEEGSDFARSRRQQEVFVALKDKLISPWLWFSPRRAKRLVIAADKMTETDMTLGELLIFGKQLARIPEKDLKKIALEDQLASPPLWLYGRYVLVPKEDFAAIHTYIKDQLR